MGIKPLFSPNDIRARLNAEIEKIEKQAEARLIRIGNKFVRDARSKTDDKAYTEALQGISKSRGLAKAILEADSPSFTDRTGNLRSSIGFVLLKDGKVVKSDFEQTLEGSEGKAQAIRYASGEADRFVFGYALIVVAGMEYAAAVESKGYDVISGSSIEATNALNKYFKKK